MSEQKKRRRDCYDLDFHFNSYLFSIWKRDGTHFYMVLVFTSLSSTVDLLFLSFCCDLFFLHSLFPFPLLKYTHPAWVDPIQGNWQSESVREYFLCRDLCAHFGKSISLFLSEYSIQGSQRRECILVWNKVTYSSWKRQRCKERMCTKRMLLDEEERKSKRKLKETRRGILKEKKEQHEDEVNLQSVSKW